MRSLNPWLLTFTFLVFLLLGRFVSVLVPNQYYFSFSAFLLDNRDLNKPLALFVKLAQPFGIGFLGVLLIGKLARIQAIALGHPGSLTTVLDEQAPLTFAFSAGLVALLLAWPFILLWDILIDPMLAPYRAIYLLSYLAYAFAYFFFALSGAQTASVFALAMQTDGVDRRLSISALRKTDFGRPIYNALSGVLTTTIATFLASSGA